MAKPDIHPTWYPDAKVICNGEVVMTTGSTKPELHVDVWSGNHPFYTGTQKILDTEGRVDRFMRKYGMATTDSAASDKTAAPTSQASASTELAKPESAASEPAPLAAEASQAAEAGQA
jgi:large subunit ribosomal protein L31